MFNRLCKISACLSFLAVAACSPSAFDGAVSELSLEVDTSKSEIKVTTTDNIADGISQTAVLLKLRNRKGKGVAGVKSEIGVSGSNNTLIPCTVSDEDGNSSCRFMSTTAEEKTIWLIGPLQLKTTVTMMTPAPTTMLFGFVASGDVQVAPTGHKFLSTSGISEAPALLFDSSGISRTRTSLLGTLLDLE